MNLPVGTGAIVNAEGPSTPSVSAIDNFVNYSPHMTLEMLEKRYILKALKYGGTKVEIAARLGITVKTLYNKMHRYDIYGEFRIWHRGENG